MTCWLPNELSNPVFAEAAVERALKLNGHAPLLSRNEARDIVGMEPVLGGDTIYGSIGDVAQAEDYFTNHGVNDHSANDNSLEAYREARPDAQPALPKPKPEPTAADKDAKKALDALSRFAEMLTETKVERQTLQ